MKPNIRVWSYIAHFFLEWEMFRTNVVEKIKTHLFCLVSFFFRKSCRLWDNLGKYGRTGQAAGDSTAVALCMLDNQGCGHTLRILFSTATMVTLTRLNVTLIVHCLSCREFFSKGGAARFLSSYDSRLIMHQFSFAVLSHVPAPLAKSTLCTPWWHIARIGV